MKSHDSDGAPTEFGKAFGLQFAHEITPVVEEVLAKGRSTFEVIGAGVMAVHGATYPEHLPGSVDPMAVAFVRIGAVAREFLLRGYAYGWTGEATRDLLSSFLPAALGPEAYGVFVAFVPGK